MRLPTFSPRRRALGFILTDKLPWRVRVIAHRDLRTAHLLRGFLFQVDEDRAHRHLVRRVLHFGGTLEDAASAVFHADDGHRLERAMDIALQVSQEKGRAA